MSFKFDPVTQAFIEVKEATKWERTIRQRRQYSQFIVVPIMVVVLVVGLSINWHFNKIETTQSAIHKSGVSQ